MVKVLVTHWPLFLLAIIHLTGTVEMGFCAFPEFLWKTASGTRNRKWQGRTEYLHNTEFLERRTEILAKETEINIKEIVYAPCDRNIKPGEYTFPCHQEEIMINYICIAEEPNGKFRLQQETKGLQSFSCIKFVKRNENLLQIYKAPAEGTNEDWLCYDDYLLRDEWPWMATEKLEWDYCSLQGGFDFYSYIAPEKEKLCPEEWIPSRVESECIKGDGLQFTFPSPECSPFQGYSQDVSFYCWASWNELDYTFMLFGENGKAPRYVLRVPKECNVYDELNASLYLYPVAPLDSTGKPQANIGHFDLEMLRSEPGVCFDVSRECVKYAMQGKCTSTGLHQYANFCQKSCGLCAFAASPRAECSFPEVVQGDWVGFSPQGPREQVTVGAGEIHFSSLPTLICKSRHWQHNLYKVFTDFNNGCRSRFSCIDLGQGEGQTINFRLSVIIFDQSANSDRTDRSFQLCRFQDDPLPLGNLIRSASPKIWLPISSMFHGSCGINGEARVWATFVNGQNCSGTAWDVDRNNCETTSYMSLNLPTCKQTNIEYMCVAFLRQSGGTAFIVTTKVGPEPQYICWIQREEVRLKEELPALVYTRVRCDTAKPPNLRKNTDDITEFTVYNDLTGKPCGRNTNEAQDQAIFTKSTVSPYVEKIHHEPYKSAHESLQDNTDIHTEKEGPHLSDSKDYVYDQYTDNEESTRRNNPHRHKNKHRYRENNRTHKSWEQTEGTQSFHRLPTLFPKLEAVNTYLSASNTLNSAVLLCWTLSLHVLWIAL